MAALEQKQAATSAPFEVWPENWPAVELFRACETQWRISPVTEQSIGLDYAAVGAVGRMLNGETPARALLTNVRDLEIATLRNYSAKGA